MHVIGGVVTPKELTAIRRALKLSQAAFAETLGVSGGRAIRKWEAGDRPIPEYVAKLARSLG